MCGFFDSLAVFAPTDHERKFNDGFPMFQMSAESPDRIIEIIGDCIKNNKDVYDSGYLSLDDDTIY